MRRGTPVLILVLAAVIGALMAPVELVAAKKKKPKKAEDLTNIYLSPTWSQWLVGPIVMMATEGEVAQFLALMDDASAEAFINEFWKTRDPEPDWRGGSLRERFEERAKAADKRFGEAAYSGRRTDRGKIFILYGEPTQITFEVTRDQRKLQIEHWYYSDNVADGFDGGPPDRHYWFAKTGDLTEMVPPPRKQSRSLTQPISQQ